MPPVPELTETTRWRCRLCGNLTRFDVTRTSRVVEYLHLDLSGAATVEERQVLSNVIERVRCRWCDAVDQVDRVERPAGSPVPDADDASASGDPADR